MKNSNSLPIVENRYEFMVVFDVTNGNPNGDPDADNMARIDPETGHGLVTDVCLKRKIRNYVEDVHGDKPGFGIYIKENVPLNRSDAEAITAVTGDSTGKKIKELTKKDPELGSKLRGWMCQNFFDIRTFGAVMTTFIKGDLKGVGGQVRGPVQIGFARSVEPISPMDVTITRVAITTEADAEKKNTEMGHKYIVPYGLYTCKGYISASFAEKTGFSEEDLGILWDAIANMFENDHSATRGEMCVRDLIIFKHDSKFGDAHSYEVFDTVKIERVSDPTFPARSYSDYSVTVDEESLPDSVHCSHWK